MNDARPARALASLNQFTLRSEPRLQDREALQEILTSAGFFYPHEIDVAIELLDDRLSKGETSEYQFILADLAGETVGYICYGPITVTDRRYDLYWIAVRQDMRGKGIGGVLLREAEQKILGLGGKYIYVETSSRSMYEPTRQFYLRNNYREVARVPYYYADDDDRVIFLRALG